MAKIRWQPRHGSFAFTVVCKATFELRPELSPLAAAQEPVVEADVYSGEGGLARASELVPFKKRPEVLVSGHAHAPEGRPVPSLVATLAVGDEIYKSILLVGDRCWGLDGRLGEPAPFTRMPLSWDRAAGGAGTLNPAGRLPGRAARADLAGRVLAPNLLPVGLQLTSPSAVVPPVGFGPIAPSWPSRAACLQRHAAFWDPGRWHERPLPDDIDLGYFNAAPPDQQRAQPFGEEAIYLENLHPRFARLSTRLAPVTPVATVDHGAGPQRLQLRCDTLVVDTDRGLAMLVWRAHALLDSADPPGRVVVTGPGVPAAAVSASVHETLDTVQHFAAAPVLPFSGAAPRAPSSLPPLTAADVAPASLAAADLHAASRGAGTGAGAPPLADGALDRTEAPGLVPSSATLPFTSTQRQSVLPGDVPSLGSALALPFGPPSEPPRPRAPLSGPAAEPPGPYEPSFAASTAPEAPYLAQAPLMPATEAADRVEHRLEPASSANGEPPAPPPLLGAIAAVSAEAAGAPVSGWPEAAALDATEAPGLAPEPAPEVAFDAYPPERCGAIAARLACDAGSTGDVLRAEELDEARWERVHAHWLDRIRDDAARSRTGLLSVYDSAYVSALEAQRGPVTLADYARLAEAAERGAITGALAERGLPEGAWPHIHRVWIQRMVKDVLLGKQVRREIEALRAAG
ncbi:DUF2169 domain-containing protein [Sorangium sp. So ce1024]|uniref:DUF2169 family type VI secretion system accessory protein n=1 Tax=Sorangium sp. So ce1024 TaxID=3133327 RepID=UPI003F050B86